MFLSKPDLSAPVEKSLQGRSRTLDHYLDLIDANLKQNLDIARLQSFSGDKRPTINISIGDDTYLSTDYISIDPRSLRSVLHYPGIEQYYLEVSPIDGIRCRLFQYLEYQQYESGKWRSVNKFRREWAAKALRNGHYVEAWYMSKGIYFSEKKELMKIFEI